MTIRRVLTTSLLIGFGLIGTLSVTQGIQSVNAQERGQDRTLMAQGERGPGGNGPRGRGMARFCEGDGIEGHVEKMGEAIEELDLTNTQEQYWDDVVDTAESLEIDEACESGDRAAIREQAQEMREPMHTFFESLSDEQRETLRALKPERPDGNPQGQRQRPNSEQQTRFNRS